MPERCQTLRITSLVEERELSTLDLTLAVRTSLEDGGWIDETMPEGDAPAMVDEAIDLIRQTAEFFPTGTVLGTRLGQVFKRGGTDAPV